MPGISFGGGSSTDQSQRDIGGYPHSGQGDQSGVTAATMSALLQKQRATNGNGFHGIKTSRFKTNAKNPLAIDSYPSRNIEDVQKTEPGIGFGGIKNLFQ